MHAYYTCVILILNVKVSKASTPSSLVQCLNFKTSKMSNLNGYLQNGKSEYTICTSILTARNYGRIQFRIHLNYLYPYLLRFQKTVKVKIGVTRLNISTGSWTSS